MAKKGGASEIASVSVGVTADTTRLSAGLNQAKAETQAAAADMAGSVGKAAGKMEGSFGDAAKSAKSIAGPMRAIVGLAGNIMAAAYGIGAAWEYVVNVFGDGKKVAEEFFRTISEGVGKQAEARLESIRDRIQSVQSELADAIENPLDPRGRSRSTIEAELKELRDRERSTSRQVQQQERLAKAAEKSAKKEAERADEAKRWQEIKQQGLDLEDKLAAEADSQAEAALRKFRMIDAMVGTLKAGGEDAIADRLAKANADAFARAMALVAKQMADEFRKVGREITDDMRNAIRESLRQVIPDIRAIGPKLDVINRSSNRLYGRGV